MDQPYELAADYLLRKVGKTPEVGIICGSGLSGLSNVIENPFTVPYEEIPGFPAATVAGHVGELVFGTMQGVQVVCLRGRFHFYEGNDMPTVALPVRVMKLIGVKMLVVTNAAGGLNPDYEVGDIAVIQDHFGGVGIHDFLAHTSSALSKPSLTSISPLLPRYFLLCSPSWLETVH